MFEESNKIYKFQEQKGAIGIKLTNDAFFHILMEKCRPALESIICAVIKIPRDSIKNIEILNPILTGEEITAKDMTLDILVLLNNDKYINIEMQATNKRDWVDRTLSYMYRVDNDLQAGDEYSKLKTVYQIGILDYTLFKDNPEFCATYRIMNMRNNKIFTDKMQIYVIDLTHIELATEDDIKAGLDKWAKFFKSEDWEELKMLASEDNTFKEAGESVYNFVENDHIRKYLEYRTKMDKISEENFQKRLETEIEENQKKIKEQDEMIQEQDEKLQEQNVKLQEKDEEIQRLRKLLEESGLALK